MSKLQMILREIISLQLNMAHDIESGNTGEMGYVRDDVDEINRLINELPQEIEK